MVVYVTKADGSKQLFDKEKIVQTCQRMGANREVAIQVPQEVEKNLYPNIATQQILQIIFAMMRKHKPAVIHLFDLKQGISLMEPKPEFEVFIRVLLAHSGFQVNPNAILRGLCGEHEVDALVTKDGLTYLMEAIPTRWLSRIPDQQLSSLPPMDNPAPNTVTCLICGKVFNTKEELTVHLETEHQRPNKKV